MSVEAFTSEGPTDVDARLLVRLLERSESILVKKLSNNDRDWARYANKHQAGVYIPYENRDGGFFPRLEIKPRVEDAAVIRETFFTTIWPQADNVERRTRLVHYTSKGQETHLTGLPKEPFVDLLPASWLVMGRRNRNPHLYECLAIDSGSEASDLLIDLMEIDADFLIGEFDPEARRAERRDKFLDFAGQVIAAWQAGDIVAFAQAHAVMPPTAKLAEMARARYFKIYETENLDPFEIERPGEVLREISRGIELELFREFQHRERAVELVRIVLGAGPVAFDAAGVIRRLIDAAPAIDALMLSASQQRKSRAGYSYEHHIEAMLLAGAIPYEKQVIIHARKRPDFILPSLKWFEHEPLPEPEGLILSAKTTLRERWKQVEREMNGRSLYLTTVDENVAGSVIDDMASFGAHLVIPENLKSASETEYAGRANVLSFKEFCETVVRPRMRGWNRPLGSPKSA